MDVILGVDGGGTKTIALIATLDGKIIGIGYGGSSNQNVVGLKKAYLNIMKAIQEAISGANANVLVSCVGLAGIDNEENYSMMSSKLKSNSFIKNLILVSDAEIALASGTWGQYGVVIIAGTGSNVYGKNVYGESARSGNWGYIIGDEGSAYYISRLALNAVFREYDGRGSHTILTEMVKSYFKVNELSEIIPIIYKRMSIPEIASLAGLVSQAARMNDSIAKSILRMGGKELGLASVAVIKKLKMENEDFYVVFVGSMFNAGKYFIEPIKREIKKVAPNAKFIRPDIPPVFGALILGYQYLKIPLTNDIKDRLIRSWLNLKTNIKV